jgi:hypothetical protein
MSVMLYCKRDMTGAINRHNVKQDVKGIQFKFNLATNLALLSHRVNL